MYKNCLSDGGIVSRPRPRRNKGGPAQEASLRRHGALWVRRETPNQAHGCSSHPPFFSMSLWSRLTLQPYKTVGKCVNLGLLGMGAHPVVPVVDVGLPAGDRDEDPLFCRIAACPCNILSCSCPIHPIQAVTLTRSHPAAPGVTRTAHWPIDGNGF